MTLTENAAAVNVEDRIYQTLSKDDVEGYYVYDSDTAVEIIPTSTAISATTC